MKGNFHIADWEIQPQINCVCRGDQTVHLEPKVMQVLVQLASNCNEVLSKEELMRAVWPDTFVGDDVLTRSISEIRRVLHDDARAPRIIQTIPKVGYRLIGTVLFDTSAAPIHAPEFQSAAAPAPAPIVQPTPAPELPSRRSNRRLWLVGVFIVLAVVAVLLYWSRLRRNAGSADQNSYITTPFTTNLGAETQPAFSPDGKQIAFVWNGENAGNRHIYVKLIGTETQLQVTSGDGEDFSPVWSPDGTSIAYLHASPTDRGIYVVASIGGPARKLYNIRGKIDVPYEWERGALSWSPDGKQLIFPDGKSSESRSSIYSLQLDTMQVKAITSPSNHIDGDFSPAFSPDGRKIAFVRGTEGYVRDLYVIDSNGDEPRRLTFDNRFVSGLAWTADSSTIIFSSDRGGRSSLWRISVNGGDPRRLPVGGDDAFSPAISVAGNRLAYSQRSAKWSILRIALSAKPEAKSQAMRLLSSTQQDSAPQFSPDGSRIAFQSLRSGAQEIWLSSSSGADLVKLTSYDGPLTGSPSWSPDGQRIAFDSRPQAHSHIYVVSVNGGVPSIMTNGNFNDIVPSWSGDGRWIYFGSNRSGDWQIWRVSSAGGEPEQVTRSGGFVARTSSDGRWVYFAKADSPGLWRVPAEGGAEVQVLKQPAVGYWGYWTLAGNEIYYLNSLTKPAAIEAFRTTDNTSTVIHQLEKLPPPFAGITVAPDGKSLLYTDLLEAGSHITLVDNFR